jgi:hypothetical protein
VRRVTRAQPRSGNDTSDLSSTNERSAEDGAVPDVLRELAEHDQ